jgi:hypothetical protein
MLKENIIKYSIVFLVFLASFFGTSYLIKNYINPPKSIEELVSSINKSCPKKVEDGIVLDSIKIENNNFIYFYTLIYEDKEKWKTNDFEGFMKPKLIELYHKSEEKSILDLHNYNLVYHYQDGFNVPISKITITSKEYKK